MNKILEIIKHPAMPESIMLNVYSEDMKPTVFIMISVIERKIMYLIKTYEKQFGEVSFTRSEMKDAVETICQNLLKIHIETHFGDEKKQANVIHYSNE